MTQKSPEQIMEELRKSYPGELRHYGFGRDIKKELQDFFRSSLASVLLWASEQVQDLSVSPIPELEGLDAIDCQVRDEILADCRSLLIEKAKEITKEITKE